MVNILIVSDTAKELYSLFRSGGFAPEGKDIYPGTEGSEAARASLDKYDIVFLDLDIDNWDQKLLELRQRTSVIAFSIPDLKKAVAAMRLGAADYLEKPLTSEVLSEVLERHKKRILNHKYGFDEITGVSRPMQNIFGLIKRAAASESNVLITGESGTGKELIARAIHRWSPRNDNSFITINCSAIPDALLESELFGFEKGSFTGANYSKKGLLEAADGGTVFFDEIGDVSALFQIKILRMLQEGEIMKIGGSRQLKVDVRIISATNKDLKTACEKGVFREDLYYRLNVINIHLPPLKERLEDVPLLAVHFVKKHSPKRKDIMIRGISDEAMNILKAYTYPGNVRELENIIERAISFAGSPEILPSDLPLEMLETSSRRRYPSPKLRESLIACERELIESALKESGGNISRAAASLGIYRQQLQRKLKDLNMQQQ